MYQLFERWFAAAIAAAILGGCSLPYEQLSVPGPIAGAETNATPLAARKGGVPLSGPATFGAEQNRQFPGSGKLTAEDLLKSGSADGINGKAFKKGYSPIATGSTEKDGVTINLANAPVAEVAKTVLGDMLGYSYTVSDKVNATITLQTVQPVSREALFEMFETALRDRDVAIVNDGQVYRVIPMAEAAAMGVPLRRSSSKGQAMGNSTDVITLRYVAASEIERIVRSIAPRANIRRADSERNVLLVSGTSVELRQIRELVDVFDVDYMRGMSFGIFPVETSDVDAIAKELDVIFANDRESPTKGVVRFVANRRLKSVLVITSSPEYLKKAESWIARIDHTARATEKGVFIYHVQNRPAVEVAQLLQKVYRASSAGSGSPNEDARASAQQGLGLGSTDPLSAGGAGQGLGGIAGGLQNSGSMPGGVQQGGMSMPAVGGPQAPQGANQGSGGQGAPAAGVAAPALGADGIGLQPQQASSVVGGGRAQDDRSTGISVTADEPNNSLVITATPEEYRRIRNILETIDVAGNQVLIEATIAEVTLNDELKFGVRWFFDKGASSLNFTDSAAGAVSNVFPGFSYLIQAANIRTIIHALSSITDVNVVSQPTLTVVENKKAFLQVGDEVPIVTQTAQAVTTPDAPIVNSVTYKNTGVILGITPRVSDSGKVVLEIEQEVGDVVETKSSGIDSPTIQQRRIKTTVNVQDGQTIVLAGLIQDRSTRERGQVPILGDIPYLGNAFKNKTDTIKRTELVIAITPQVMRDRAQIDDVTAEYRDKLNFSTRPQRRAGPDHRETLDRLQR